WLHAVRGVAQDPGSARRSVSSYASANSAGATTAPALTIAEDFPANVDNEVSTTVPGGGQHTFTVNTTLTGTLSLTIMSSGNGTRNTDGTFGFCDFTQDRKADLLDSVSNQTFFTAINGGTVTPTLTR